ncbi:MAG TPA: radical SAM protein, partial [Hyphomicrobiaceae bacterium]|nr:radical SAM protein [Hyphomicrobiaceae bacterium]
MEFRAPSAPKALEKFRDPDWTASGERRASVPLDRLDTLWINTGTLCNIECVNCYIESSPSNDRLTYISAAEVAGLLDEVHELNLGTREIAFTGGEPFMNPDFLEMLGDAVHRGFEVLVLTNAMQPMQRPKIRTALAKLAESSEGRLTIRVSLDHYTQALHESERGPRTWSKTLDGLNLLAAMDLNLAIAGRTCWNETEQHSRAGYADLITAHNWPIDPENRVRLMLLPEMDGKHDVPEITTACWSLLSKTPSDMMCATSRMVVKRKGSSSPTIVPCTLLPYDEEFEMGSSIAKSLVASGGMFADGAVKLCHSHCAKFCVL